MFAGYEHWVGSALLFFQIASAVGRAQGFVEQLSQSNSFAEGELSANPLAGLKPPKADTKVVNALTDEQLRRLIKACQGKSLQDRRDEAIVRLMAETGMRAGEVLALEVSDLKLQDGLVTVVRGKGGKGRICPFGSQTAANIDR